MSEFDAIPSATITADLGQGVVEQAVTSWSIDRTLSGGGLPGQARAASGSSVGSGSVSVESDATPWNAGAIKPAGRVTVSAAEDVGTAASRVGTMVVRSVGAPSALSSQRELSIEDDLGGLRGPVTIPTALVINIAVNNGAPGAPNTPAPMDAAWAIVAAANAGGFQPHGRRAPSAVLDLPLQGSAAPALGRPGRIYTQAGAPWSGAWQTRDGRMFIGDDVSIVVNGRFTSDVSTTQDLYFAFTASHTSMSSGIGVELGNRAAADATPPGDVYTGPEALFAVSVSSGGVGSVQMNGGDPSAFAFDPLSKRIVVHFQRVSSAEARVRARSAQGDAWSAWAVSKPTPAPRLPSDGAFDEVGLLMFNTRRVNAFQVATNDDTNLYAGSDARIGASGARMTALTTPRATSAWSLAQEVAAATLGAVWIDEDGVLTYRNREQLRGSGTPTETVYSLDSLDDVPWEVSTDDVADRVEVSYNPPAITQVSDYSATVWQSTEIVTIHAGQTVTIEQDIDGAADDLAPWYPAWNTTVAPATRYSRWAASTLPGGGGPQPADNALDITAEMVNPSRVRIRIRNTTTGTLYTAGTDGTTLLTLRTNVIARPSEPLTLSTGLPADKAIAPLSIDLGSWVQDQDAAQEILSWLTGTLSQPLPILRQVGVTPKASRRLGDVIVIRDPYTELASKALITGIHSSGEAGRYSQSLDLAILAALESDVARRWTAIPLATEADIAAYITAQLGGSATEADVARWLSTEVLA